jgi:hypothetical protein
MTNQVDPAADVDPDSEPTMTAPPEGRPDGVEDVTATEQQGGVHSSEADDQLGSEAPEGE